MPRYQVDGPEFALGFGRFRLLGQRRVLLEDGKPVRLGSRAMNILIALVERHGEVVSKRDLLAAGWPDAVVEESSLRVHISALRQILSNGDTGSRLIINVAGRGYSFGAPVSLERIDPKDVAEPPSTGRTRRSLPSQLTRVIGRGEAIAMIAEQVTGRRLATIVGPGGIGKTTASLAVAERLASSFNYNVHFIDLAPLSDPELVPSAVAYAFGLALPPDDPLSGLAAYLYDRNDLIVLDCCDQVVNATALLVDALISRVPGVAFLATSREPLRGETEWVYRLPALACPDPAKPISTEAAMAFPAVELFVERVGASLDVAVTESEMPAVIAICADLDGNPLAIEIAAARVDAFGIAGLAERLDDRLLLEAQGRRTALPRHQTIGALIDWSYELLSDAERIVLRRLAPFRSSFTEAGAIAVAGENLDAAPVLDQIAGLASKSLLSADLSQDPVAYRLPAITRAYASARLAESGEVDAVCRRHAQYCLDVLRVGEAEADAMSWSEWLAIYAPMIDDARAGLDWCFGPGGDLTIGLELTAAFRVLGFRMRLNDELLARIEHALSTYPFMSAPSPVIEAQLVVSFALIKQQITGPNQEVTAAVGRGLDLAEQVGLPEIHITALLGAFGFAIGSGDYHGIEDFARRMTMVSTGMADPGAKAIARRITALSQFYVGNFRRSLAMADDFLSRPIVAEPVKYSHFQLSHAVSMRIIKSRTLWLFGFADQAVTVAGEAVHHAGDGTDHALCQAYAMAAIPIAIWRGDDDAAAAMIMRLKEHSRRYGLGWWLSWAAHFEQILKWRARGDVPSIRTSVVPPAGALLGDLLVSLDVAYCNTLTMTRAEAGAAPWCAPEILRSRGVQILGQRDKPSASAEAERYFHRALELARRHEAVAWELRAATSLARLWVSGGRTIEARDLLAPVHARITEGLATLDVAEATKLLADLPA